MRKGKDREPEPVPDPDPQNCYLLMVPVVAEVGVLDAAVRHAVLSGQEPCTVLTHGSSCG